MSIHGYPAQHDDFETETIEEVFVAVYAGDLDAARAALGRLHAAGRHGIAERVRRCKRKAAERSPEMPLSKAA